jgi:hypothetical protein
MTRGTNRPRCPGETADPDVGDVAFTEPVRDPRRSASSGTAVLRRYDVGAGCSGPRVPGESAQRPALRADSAEDEVRVLRTKNALLAMGGAEGTRAPDPHTARPS